jgi:hypothetical protein
MNKEEQLFEQVYDLVKDFEGDVTGLLESVAISVGQYQEEISAGIRKKNAEELKKLAKEIFEICADANYIPVAIETDSEKDFVVQVEFAQIWDYCCDYLAEKDENDYGLEMPTQKDYMTFGGWKDLKDKWKKMIELAGYKHSVSHDGDYCYDFHLGVIGFHRESETIEEYYDINR